MKLPFFILFLLAFLCSSVEPHFKDIPPKKGDITKNIHILFDKSGSMSISDFERGYKEIEAMAMQGTDEFNLALTVFAADTLRMKVKDPDCKLKPNWMSMPSAIHASRLIPWVKRASVIDGSTCLLPAIKRVIEENKENVTVIVISDCIISDGVDSLDYIEFETKKKGVNKIKLGFVNVSKTTYVQLYQKIKKNGHWYISVYKEND